MTLVLYRKCKWGLRHWNYYIIQHLRSCSSHTIQGKRAAENRATEKENVMEETNKQISLPYMDRCERCQLNIPKSLNVSNFKHIDTEEEWCALVKYQLANLKRKAFEPSSAVEDLWKTFFTDPSKCFDNRNLKTNKKYPDFKLKDSAEALWLDDKRAPPWVLNKLHDLEDEDFAQFASKEEMWKSFLVDPSKWLDYRTVKKWNTCPDFVHRDTYAGLWLEAIETPSWIKLMFRKPQGEAFALSPAENLWITFFNDPSKWFDNRKIKKSNKYPDFKHKGTREALWIENINTPSWVFSKLNDMRGDVFVPTKSMENMWKTFFADPLKWLDYRKVKKNSQFPDFRHKVTHESLWIGDVRTPAWVLAKLNELRDEAFESSQIVEDMWISVFVDPSKWLDCRNLKKSNKHPDFRHKDTSEALWIEDKKTPAWVTLMLTNLKIEAFAPFPSVENLWKCLFDNPTNWFDNRKLKKSNKSPDFKNKYTREALWIDNEGTPDWVLPKLNNLQFELASYEAKWKDFFASPSKWFDNRTTKRSANAPDFRHKNTKEALWIANNLTPNWVVPCLSKLVDSYK